MEKFVEPNLERSIKHCAAYAITHVKTGKVYVGSSHDVMWRIARHKSLLAAGIHSNPGLQEAYNDDPELSFKIHLTFNRDEAYDYEQEILDYYLPQGLLFNVRGNAREASIGTNPTEETRKKISEANKDLKRTSTTREKIRQAKLGVPRSEQMREFLRQRQLGKKYSEETRRKQSEQRRGRKMPPRTAEHIENIRLAKVDFRHSRSSIEAIRANAPNAKAVMIEGVQYRSASEASRALGLDHKTIRRRIADENYPDWLYV